jgi:hypothetical protein
MKKLLIALLIGIGIYGYLQNKPNIISSSDKENIQSNHAIAKAYQKKISGIQVSGSGRVTHILSDDNIGSRHQRFILRIPSGQTLLIVHNIDLAPRINNLQKGDLVQFFGEYEWNSNGGIVHWTHRDPSGRHIGGWLEHNGQKYE